MHICIMHILKRPVKGIRSMVKAFADVETEKDTGQAVIHMEARVRTPCAFCTYASFSPHVAIRQGSAEVFVVPPGVSLAPFGVCFEASIEQQEDSRFRASPTNPTGVSLL